MSYDPNKDFVCYGRDKYGDALMTCYQSDSIYICNEDREVLGKCQSGHGCTPSENTNRARAKHILVHDIADIK